MTEKEHLANRMDEFREQIRQLETALGEATQRNSRMEPTAEEMDHLQKLLGGATKAAKAAAGHTEDEPTPTEAKK